MLVRNEYEVGRLIELLLTTNCTLIIPFKGVKLHKVAYRAYYGRIMKFSGTGTYDIDAGDGLSLHAVREEFLKLGELISDEGEFRFESMKTVKSYTTWDMLHKHTKF